MFVSEITQVIKKTFEEILEERSLFSLKRPSSLELISSESEIKNELSLWLKNVQIIEDEKGSFNAKNSDGRFISYRNPQKIQIQFALVSQGLTAEKKIKLFEKIYQFFFENRTIEAIVPEELKKQSILFEKLQKTRAEISTQDVPPSFHQYALYLPFSYSGPYHSGEINTEGTLVSKKQLTVNGNSNERKFT